MKGCWNISEGGGQTGHGGMCLVSPVRNDNIPCVVTVNTVNSTSTSIASTPMSTPTAQHTRAGPFGATNESDSTSAYFGSELWVYFSAG